eukprot:3832406-Amphidinium_carterae.1
MTLLNSKALGILKSHCILTDMLDFEHHMQQKNRLKLNGISRSIINHGHCNGNPRRKAGAKGNFDNTTAMRALSRSAEKPKLSAGAAQHHKAPSPGDHSTPTPPELTIIW